MKNSIANLVASIGLAALLFESAGAADPQTMGEIVDDTLVTTKVKAQLVADPVTKAHQISVNTNEGIVKLSGFVDSPAAEQRAIEIARNTAGVDAVDDDLEVRR